MRRVLSTTAMEGMSRVERKKKGLEEDEVGKYLCQMMNGQRYCKNGIVRERVCFDYEHDNAVMRGGCQALEKTRARWIESFRGGSLVALVGFVALCVLNVFSSAVVYNASSSVVCVVIYCILPYLFGLRGDSSLYRVYLGVDIVLEVVQRFGNFLRQHVLFGQFYAHRRTAYACPSCSLMEHQPSDDTLAYFDFKLGVTLNSSPNCQKPPISFPPCRHCTNWIHQTSGTTPPVQHSTISNNQHDMLSKATLDHNQCLDFVTQILNASSKSKRKADKLRVAYFTPIKDDHKTIHATESTAASLDGAGRSVTNAPANNQTPAIPSNPSNINKWPFARSHPQDPSVDQTSPSPPAPHEQTAQRDHMSDSEPSSIDHTDNSSLSSHSQSHESHRVRRRRSRGRTTTTQHSDTQRPSSASPRRRPRANHRRTISSTGAPLLSYNDDDHSCSSLSTMASNTTATSPSQTKRAKTKKRNKKSSKRRHEILEWVDVGTRLGIRLLNNENLINGVVMPDSATAPANSAAAMPHPASADSVLGAVVTTNQARALRTPASDGIMTPPTHLALSNRNESSRTKKKPLKALTNFMSRNKRDHIDDKTAQSTGIFTSTPTLENKPTGGKGMGTDNATLSVQTTLQRPSPPVHSIWTSPTAVAAAETSMSSLDCTAVASPNQITSELPLRDDILDELETDVLMQEDENHNTHGLNNASRSPPLARVLNEDADFNLHSDLKSPNPSQRVGKETKSPLSDVTLSASASSNASPLLESRSDCSTTNHVPANTSRHDAEDVERKISFVSENDPTHQDPMHAMTFGSRPIISGAKSTEEGSRRPQLERRWHSDKSSLSAGSASQSGRMTADLLRRHQKNSIRHLDRKDLSKSFSPVISEGEECPPRSTSEKADLDLALAGHKGPFTVVQQESFATDDAASIHDKTNEKVGTHQGFEVELHNAPQSVVSNVGLAGEISLLNCDPQHPLQTASAPLPPRRGLLVPGIKIVVPIFPSSHFAVKGKKKRSRTVGASCHGFYQMATVTSCSRIFIPTKSSRATYNNYAARRILDNLGGPLNPPNKGNEQRGTNALSITVILDISILRNGSFAQMHLRIRDQDPMPKHSKFPIGSCVATAFGIGVLVGWRVQDDVHVVRSLWQRRGRGSSCAYLQRDRLFGVVEAAIGFNVITTLGKGRVVAYTQCGKDFMNGQFSVQIHFKNHRSFKQIGSKTIRGAGNIDSTQVIAFHRREILSCPSARFIPIIEQVREAAKFQIQLDDYEEAMQLAAPSLGGDRQLLRKEWSESEDWFLPPLWWCTGIERAVSYLFQAVSEDPNFDIEMNTIVANVIRFLEQFDLSNGFEGCLIGIGDEKVPEITEDKVYHCSANESNKEISVGGDGGLPEENGYWLFDALFSGLTRGSKKDESKTDNVLTFPSDDAISFQRSSPEKGISVALSGGSLTNAISSGSDSNSFSRPAGVIRTLMRAVTIARVDAESEHARIALSSAFELLVFIRTAFRVRKKDISTATAKERARTITLVKETLEPIQHRIAQLGSTLKERMERKGKKVRARFLRLMDMMLRDDSFIAALENGQWDLCISMVEYFVVKARILEADSCAQLRESITILYKTLVPKEDTAASKGAAGRSGQKMAWFAKLFKWIATPKRTILRLFTRDDVLEVIERILVRVFRDNDKASQMLNIFAFNFHSFRHLFMLKNMEISKDLWIPLLEAAHEEFAWAVSRLGEGTQEFGELISKLFALGVLHLKVMWSGEAVGDWMDFLMDDSAVQIIQELDRKILHVIERSCNDLNAALEVLPYYSSFDEDFLDLLDKVDVNKVLKEAAEAIVDRTQFAKYLNRKCVSAIDRFLDDLPKMRIPVEKREISDGWVLTCKGKDGGDLFLSHVSVKRENMTCRVMGSGNKLADWARDSLLGDELLDVQDEPEYLSHSGDNEEEDGYEVSILDHVRQLLVNAQQFGCWEAGTGGVGAVKSTPYVASALKGLAVSEVLNTGIELWRNLEIDDDELMEIAIRDVSYQIQLQKEREQALTNPDNKDVNSNTEGPTNCGATRTSFQMNNSSDSSDNDGIGRFNPRRDPTVLFLEMKHLSCRLDEFKFRIEPKKSLSLFDPTFEGTGTLTISNVSIKMGLECRKERVVKRGAEVKIPVLQLHEFDVALDEVKLVFSETGFDWLLNPVVTGLSDSITEIVEVNLKEQLECQLLEALEHVNSFIETNPHILLHVLGITMDDLEENVVWV